MQFLILNISVCFRIKNGTNEENENLAKELKKRKTSLMTTSEWNGKTYLRASFNHFSSTSDDVETIFGFIVDALNTIK